MRPILRVGGDRAGEDTDVVAREEPLEIRVVGQLEGRPFEKSLSITMRTPGHDLELAAGFLFTEALIQDRRDIACLAACGPVMDGVQNVVKVELGAGVPLDLPRLERHFYATSSCGVCGKSSLESLSMGGCAPIVEECSLAPQVVHVLPDRLRQAQAVFDRTGGLHAAALFDLDGRLVALREDVGRHNALDKLIGLQLLGDRLPLERTVLFLSGRVSFELVQKALRAHIPIIAAVGAPSSLAVDLARQFDVTLLGFVRNGRFNVYAGERRIPREVTPS